VREFGRYVTFMGENVERIPYLQPVEAIGVNGLHAIVIAPVLVRVDMLRKGRTYEVVITRHEPAPTNNGARPRLATQILFRGIHGRLELDLAGKDKTQVGLALPTFLSLAGEPTPIPGKFTAVLKAVTKAVSCDGCSHAHYLIRPLPRAELLSEAAASGASLNGREEPAVETRVASS
jgi:hypothetical protein